MRIVGVLVAIDEYNGRRIYTVDDSTGVCIECTMSLPTPEPKRSEAIRNSLNAENQATKSGNDPTTTKSALYPDIDVGMVVDVKGSLRLFRDQKQIKIERLQHIRSTNQEVQFWNKIRDFRTEVLSHAWVLERKVVRKLEKENKTDLITKEKDKRKRLKAATGQASSRRERVRHGFQTYSLAERGSLKESYRPSKLSTVTTAVRGQYDALGL